MLPGLLNFSSVGGGWQGVHPGCAAPTWHVSALLLLLKEGSGTRTGALLDKGAMASAFHQEGNAKMAICLSHSVWQGCCWWWGDGCWSPIKMEREGQVKLRIISHSFERMGLFPGWSPRLPPSCSNRTLLPGCATWSPLHSHFVFPG